MRSSLSHTIRYQPANPLACRELKIILSLPISLSLPVFLSKDFRTLAGVLKSTVACKLSQREILLLARISP